MDAFVVGSGDEFVRVLTSPANDDLAPVGEDVVGCVPSGNGERVGVFFPVVCCGEADFAHRIAAVVPPAGLCEGAVGLKCT